MASPDRDARLAMVRRVEAPAPARELSTLARVDYDDAHVLETPEAPDRTAEGWARAILEGAPAAMRGSLLAGWSSLGLRMGSPRDPQRVLGWEVRASAPDHLLLGADSRVGMPAEVVVLRERDGVVVATLVQHRNALVRALWAGFAAQHREVVRRLLASAPMSDPS